MKADDRSGTDDAGRFQTTRWDAVLLSAQTQAPGSQAALAELCRLYWYPIYVFIRGRGYSAQDAEDLTQGFFLSLLEHKALRRVTPARGKFRSFLRASVRNYLSDEHDREHSLKRGRNIEFVPLDFEGADERYQSEPHEALTPEKIFDARWAMTLLDATLGQLREEYVAQGKLTIFEILKPFLGSTSNQKLPPHEQVAEKLNATQGRVRTLIHRLRKRYGELLREKVAQTVTEPADIEEEIHGLCDALIAAEGRLAHES